jgi:hypothetical protein
MLVLMNINERSRSVGIESLLIQWNVQVGFDVVRVMDKPRRTIRTSLLLHITDPILSFGPFSAPALAWLPRVPCLNA